MQHTCLWVALPEADLVTEVWVQEIYLENDLRNNVRDMGSEKTKKRKLMKCGYQASYHCGQLGNFGKWCRTWTSELSCLRGKGSGVCVHQVPSLMDCRWLVCLCGAGLGVDSLVFCPTLVFSRVGSRSQRMPEEKDAVSSEWCQAGCMDTMNVQRKGMGRAVTASATVPNFVPGIHYMFNK